MFPSLFSLSFFSLSLFSLSLFSLSLSTTYSTFYSFLYPSFLPCLPFSLFLPSSLSISWCSEPENVNNRHIAGWLARAKCWHSLALKILNSTLSIQSCIWHSFLSDISLSFSPSCDRFKTEVASFVGSGASSESRQCSRCRRLWNENIIIPPLPLSLFSASPLRITHWRISPVTQQL